MTPTSGSILLERPSGRVVPQRLYPSLNQAHCPRIFMSATIFVSWNRQLRNSRKSLSPSCLFSFAPDSCPSTGPTLLVHESLHLQGAEAQGHPATGWAGDRCPERLGKAAVAEWRSRALFCSSVGKYYLGGGRSLCTFAFHAETSFPSDKSLLAISRISLFETWESPSRFSHVPNRPARAIGPASTQFAPRALASRLEVFNGGGSAKPDSNRAR